MGSAQPGGRSVHFSNPFATGVTLASQAPTSERCSKSVSLLENMYAYLVVNVLYQNGKKMGKAGSWAKSEATHTW